MSREFVKSTDLSLRLFRANALIKVDSKKGRYVAKEKEDTGGSRRDFLVRTGKILSVVIWGGIIPGDLSVNLGSDAATDSPEIPNTFEPTDDDSFWYARDLMGLID